MLRSVKPLTSFCLTEVFRLCPLAGWLEDFYEKYMSGVVVGRASRCDRIVPNVPVVLLFSFLIVVHVGECGR